MYSTLNDLKKMVDEAIKEHGGDTGFIVLCYYNSEISIYNARLAKPEPGRKKPLLLLDRDIYSG